MTRINTPPVPSGYSIAIKKVIPIGEDGINVISSTNPLPMKPVAQEVYNIIELPFVQTLSVPLFLAIDTVCGSYTATLAPEHGFVNGNEIVIAQNSTMNAFFYAKILNVATNVLTFDTPLPVEFNATKALCFKVSSSMNVNGSITPIIFKITNNSSMSIDLHEISFQCLSSSGMDDGKFGNLNALTRGVVIREKFNPTCYQNFYNFKTNGELRLISGYLDYIDKAPAGSGYGYGASIPLGDYASHGSPMVIGPGESAEIIIQDDLTGLTYFKANASAKVIPFN